MVLIDKSRDRVKFKLGVVHLWVKGCVNISGKKCQSELFKEAKSKGQEKGIKGLDLTCKTHLLEKNCESDGQQLMDISDAVFTEIGLNYKLNWPLC